MALQFPANPTTGQRYLNYVFTGVVWTVQAGTLAEAPNTPIGYARDGASGVWVPESPNHNKFVNPFVEIDQLNEGATIAVTGAINIAAVADMFAVFGQITSPGSVSADRASAGGPTGSPFCLSMTTGTAAPSVGAGDWLFLAQTLEADEIYDTGFGTTAAQPLTLSFWAWCTIPGTYYISIQNAAFTRSYVAPYTITTASTWQLITITIPGDTAGTWVTSGNAGGMRVGWSIACGTGNQAPTNNTWLSGNFIGSSGQNNAFLLTVGAQFRLGPCKLEVGSKATPILRTSFQQELARCQRYYEKSYNFGTAPGTITYAGCSTATGFSGATGPWNWSAVAPFKVIKRAVPSITLYNPHDGTAGASGYDQVNNGAVVAGVANIGQSVCFINMNQTNGFNAFQVSIQWTADARI